jgi:hypothetical protein
MAKKLHAITVRGKQHEWTFNVYVDPKYLPEWRDDGLEIVELGYIIPEWIQDKGYGAMRVWCFLQDCFHFRNPFKHWRSDERL